MSHPLVPTVPPEEDDLQLLHFQILYERLANSKPCTVACFSAAHKVHAPHQLPFSWS